MEKGDRVKFRRAWHKRLSRGTIIDVVDSNPGCFWVKVDNGYLIPIEESKLEALTNEHPIHVETRGRRRKN